MPRTVVFVLEACRGRNDTGGMKLLPQSSKNAPRKGGRVENPTGISAHSHPRKSQTPAPGKKSKPLAAATPAQQTWSGLCTTLRGALGEQGFHQWLVGVTAEISGSELILTAPTIEQADSMRASLHNRLLALWQRHHPELETIRYAVRHHSPSSAPPSDNPHYLAQLPGSKPRTRKIARKLVADFTFDQFLVDPTNELAAMVLQQLAEDSTRNATKGCFVLHGKPGVGKTHLLHALCHSISQAPQAPAALMLTCEEFVADFVHAVRRGRTSTDLQLFKNFFRSREILLIDDFHFLAGKLGSQEELVRIIDDMRDGTVIIAANSWPGEWRGFIDPLQSRMMNALHLRIDAPHAALRHRIIEHKAMQHGVTLCEGVASYLAETIKDSPRVLEGAIRKLAAYESLLGRPATIDSIQSIFSEYAALHRPRIGIDDVQRVVARHFAMTIDSIVSKNRARHISQPRQIAMLLARRLTEHSLPEIGQAFGGRDHATVIYSLKKIEALAQSDSQVKQTIDTLSNQLTR